MIQKLTADNHKQPFKGPFTITRIQPGAIFIGEKGDTAFGPLSIIDHALMKKGVTIKMHEHVNDEILSYIWQGTMYHKDSTGLEVAVSPGNLMMMNAGYSFWHEEKVKKDQVEMLQIFIRPREKDLEPIIQFHEKAVANREWYLMVGPEDSHAPLHVRQNVYILDAHPKKGDKLKVPVYQGLQPFLYVVDGEISINDLKLKKQEAIIDLDHPLPPITATEDSSVVLFFVDMKATMSMLGTVSGNRKIQ
ncbi:pirin family protein [Bacillus sp. FJAT-50079]|uniref:pirin family protein n=1 Tax=Bacillus sp. FJAT-50079 TaxID=2833577 RepID=UPI001BC95386|nr:pirin family protein [Bacillus sp. FJAT-50079]MBS4210592.1 pirin family protein [Bacillus sp. FJAT-50079]